MFFKRGATHWKFGETEVNSVQKKEVCIEYYVTIELCEIYVKLMIVKLLKIFFFEFVKLNGDEWN